MVDIGDISTNTTKCRKAEVPDSGKAQPKKNPAAQRAIGGQFAQCDSSIFCKVISASAHQPYAVHKYQPNPLPGALNDAWLYESVGEFQKSRIPTPAIFTCCLAICCSRAKHAKNAVTKRAGCAMLLRTLLFVCDGQSLLRSKAHVQEYIAWNACCAVCLVAIARKRVSQLPSTSTTYRIIVGLLDKHTLPPRWD